MSILAGLNRWLTEFVRKPATVRQIPPPVSTGWPCCDQACPTNFCPPGCATEGLHQSPCPDCQDIA